MFRVEIYYNKNGELTLMQYDENDRPENQWQGRAVKILLDKIKEEKIENVYIDEENTGVIAYEDAIINVRNISKKRNDPYMQDYLSLVDKTIKQQNEERAAIVTRKNKHRGPLTFTTSVLTAALILTMIAGAKVDSATFSTTTPGIVESYTTQSPETFVDTIVTETRPLETQPPQEETPIIEDFAFIDYTDRSASQKLETTRELYGDTITKYAHTYGLDPDLVLALATQERGVHSNKMDPGGATGLMQIQNAVWVGSDITAYNFNTESYEKVKVTKEKIEDCETNIKIGCMILQDMIRAKNYNVIAGVLSYNMGGYNVNKILKKYEESSGITYSEILENQTDCNWLKHRDIIKVGDQNYVQHVFSYMGNDIDTYVIKPSGEIVEVAIKNYDATKTVNSR